MSMFPTVLLIDDNPDILESFAIPVKPFWGSPCHGCYTVRVAEQPLSEGKTRITARLCDHHIQRFGS